MKSVRPAYGISQATTIMIEKEHAKRITQSGRIRVGLSVCKAEENIEVERCFNAGTTGTD